MGMGGEYGWRVGAKGGGGGGAPLLALETEVLERNGCSALPSAALRNHCAAIPFGKSKQPWVGGPRQRQGAMGGRPKAAAGWEAQGSGRESDRQRSLKPQPPTAINIQAITDRQRSLNALTPNRPPAHRTPTPAPSSSPTHRRQCQPTNPCHNYITYTTPPAHTDPPTHAITTLPTPAHRPMA